MKKVLIALASVVAMTALNAKELDVIRAGVDAPYPPFAFKSPDGELTGFEIDLGNQVCMDITGQPCEWVVQAWDGIIPGLLARKYDMIFSSMSINDERKKKVLFSVPYYTTPAAFFSGNDFNPNEATGKRIGVQRATIHDTYLSEYSTDAEIVRYTTADDMVVDLQGQRLDAIFLDAPVGIEMLADSPDVTMVGEFIKEPLSIFGEGIGAAFRQRDKELEAKVSESLAKLMSNGTYEDIMNQYFTIDIKP